VRWLLLAARLFIADVDISNTVQEQPYQRGTIFYSKYHRKEGRGPHSIIVRFLGWFKKEIYSSFCSCIKILIHHPLPLQTCSHSSTRIIYKHDATIEVYRRDLASLKLSLWWSSSSFRFRGKESHRLFSSFRSKFHSIWFIYF
jgi:hypothetical protein